MVYPPTGSRPIGKGDEHPATLLIGYGTLYLTTNTTTATATATATATTTTTTTTVLRPFVRDYPGCLLYTSDAADE